MTTSARAAGHDARYSRAADVVAIDRWPSERPIFVAAVLISIVFWIVLVISVIGLAYAAFLGVFFFMLRLGMIAYVRGSAVRLGPEQLPELYARVAQLAERLGLAQVPETYLMQAGGALNAFATRFLREHLIVLYSDLLDACGDDEGARDMIIGHELGHIHAGHLRWHWFTLPATLVPFLGTALSRAREYTCDRYGLAGAGSMESAVRGLTILAAGPRLAARVNHRAFVRQRESLNTGWMTLGEWLSTHPPLAKRIAQLAPALDDGSRGQTGGVLRAAAILALIFFLPVAALTWFGASKLPAFLREVQVAADSANAARAAGAAAESDADSAVESPAAPIP